MNEIDLTLGKADLNDISQCCIFINKNLNIKISKNFYKWRYLSNGSCSFIAKYKNKIVGHVGFTKYQINYSQKNIFSRHSSCVEKKYRRRNIYSTLIDYSYNYLKKKSNFIVTWPNTINSKTSKKINYKKIKRQFIIYKSPGLSKHQNQIFPLKKYSQISNYIRENQTIGVILKNSNYYKWRYFSKNYNDKQIFYFQTNSSLFIFSYNEYNKELNLLDYLGLKKNFYRNLQFISSKIQFNFWTLKNSIMQLKLSELNFKKTNKKITNEIVFLKKYKFNKNSFFFMAETDSFINLK